MGMPAYAVQRDDGNAYVKGMTHHAHIDVNNETTVKWINLEADDTVWKASTTVAASTTYTFDNAVEIPTEFGRNVVVESTDAGDITIVGKDFLGQVMTETLTCIVGDVDGAKAFKQITGVIAAADLAGDIILKAGQELGLPFCATELVRETVDGASAADGAITAPVTAAPTATTGDVRGTYNPNTAGDGGKDISMTYITTSELTDGLYGQVQA